MTAWDVRVSQEGKCEKVQIPYWYLAASGIANDVNASRKNRRLYLGVDLGD